MISLGLRVAGVALILAGSAGYGAGVAGNYRQRLRLLEQLRQMIFLLKGQILYANAPLQEAFGSVGRRSEGKLGELFSRTADRIDGQQGEPFFQIWKEEVEGLEKETVLTGEDCRSLTALGEHLGYLDRDMQERNLLLFLEQLDLTVQELRGRREERCRLYTSLGVLGGCFLAVLLL